ncbi:hypothetical protein [Lactococcus lactis]|uniref:hypothetical protein n=1 Tax=Lactococcus lactis TaxID=1358 RepID=UPI00071C6E72|nr:hypothetical protein [Lactococcus lactis]WDA70040.1 hypothetical protein IL310_08340 [Lactococcus lactis]
MSESKGMTNNNKTVAIGPLWEIFSIPLKIKPKEELSILLFIKKGDVIQSHSKRVKGICNIKSEVFFIKGS